MKSAASTIKSLAIEIAFLFGLVVGIIAIATHGLNAKLPSLF
jgi:hypothetical protein